MRFFKPHTILEKEDFDIRREMLSIDRTAQYEEKKLHADRRRKHKTCYAEQQMKRYRKNGTPTIDPRIGLQ